MTDEFKPTALSPSGIQPSASAIVMCEAPRGGMVGNRRAFARWRNHVLANGAPRERSYMKALLTRHFRGCEVLEMPVDDLPNRDWSEFTSIVLVFPDAIGLGFSRIEEMFRDYSARKRLFALNGRGRLLRLDRPTIRRLRLRRLLAWTRIPEFLFLAVFFALTPALLAVDLVRGRR